MPLHDQVLIPEKKMIPLVQGYVVQNKNQHGKLSESCSCTISLCISSPWTAHVGVIVPAL